MIHWMFLIPAFIAGIAAGYVLIYYLAKVAAQVCGAIEEATKHITI